MPTAAKKFLTVELRESVRASPAQRGYGRRWQKERLAFLNDHPLCVECERRGLVTVATVVDHVIPHRGNQRLFWDSDGNWQALCDVHHNEKTANGL